MPSAELGEEELLLSKACALPPPVPLTWFLLVQCLAASAVHHSGFKLSEQELGSWAATAGGDSSCLPEEE